MIRFSNSFPERIVFVNRGLTVLGLKLRQARYQKKLTYRNTAKKTTVKSHHTEKIYKITKHISHRKKEIKR